MTIGNYQIISKIGNGQFAAAQIVSSQNDSTLLVAKVFKKHIEQMNLREKINFQAETDCLPLEHNNVVKTQSYNTCANHMINNKDVYRPQILLEHCKHGDLCNFIQYTGAFSENSAKVIIQQILEGLIQFKKISKSHLDLKPENILISDNQTIKIADFGFSTFQNHSEEQYMIGTEGQNSPQISEHRKYCTEKADVFSLGVVLIDILLRDPLFTSTDAKQDYNFEYFIKKNQLSEQLSKNTDLTQNCINLICNMLKQDEHERYNLSDIINHNWLQDQQIQNNTQLNEFEQKANLIQKNQY